MVFHDLNFFLICTKVYSSKRLIVSNENLPFQYEITSIFSMP